MNDLYELFHSNRKSQRKIIDHNNFTYHTLLFYINRYLKFSNKVLDVGCGVGTVDFYMAKQGAKVTGLDISKNAISVAQSDALKLNVDSNIIFKVANFPSCRLDAKFDIVVCSEVLEHVQNDETAVKKIHMLLKKSGIVIASSPSINAPLYKIGTLHGFDRKVGHLRRYSPFNFRGLFERNGFRVITVYKTEGILRNFLFTNYFGGLLLKIANRHPFSKIITFLDNLTVPLLGESNIFVIAAKK
jgi:SAM-dependent methyltransferase